MAGAQRSVLLPVVPTAQEAGVPGFVAASWNARAVPSRTPPAVSQRLHQAIAAAVRHTDVVQKLRARHVQPQDGRPAQTAQRLQSEIQRWGVVMKKPVSPSSKGMACSENGIIRCLTSLT